MTMEYRHALDDGVGEVQNHINGAAIRNIHGIQPRRMRERHAIFCISQEMYLVYASQRTRIPANGLPISSIARINWNRRHFQKVVQRDDGLGRQKPTRRRHDKRRTKASRRIRKSFRIGKLAAKIQAADEAEEFPERGAVSPDAMGEFEVGIP